MVFQEPVVEFVELRTNIDLSSSGAGYTICQKVNGRDAGDAAICAMYFSSTASMTEICAWMCDNSSSNPDNNQV